MSASLVGSEMCIRDSPEEGEQETARKGSKLTETAANCLQRCYTFAVIPVSYTHLTLPTICSV
eukprot:761044-Alexandrium_andersonii.AAC.1